MGIFHGLLASVLLAGLTVVSTAQAQQLTTEQKLKALIEAGVFDNPTDEHRDLVRLLLQPPGQNPPPTSSFEDVQDNNAFITSPGGVSDAIMAAILELPAGVFRPRPQSANISPPPTYGLPPEIVAGVLQTAIGPAPSIPPAPAFPPIELVPPDMMPGGTPTMIGGFGTPPGVIAQHQHQLESIIAGGTPNPPPNPPPASPDPKPAAWETLFPNYWAGNRTPNWQTQAPAYAVYRGKASGTAGTGVALEGSSSFHFQFTGADLDLLFAEFAFDHQHIAFGGEVTNAGVELKAHPGPSLMGGTIGVSDTFLGHFYGPGATEFGGNFSFTVDGGAAAGTATGQFATNREP